MDKKQEFTPEVKGLFTYDPVVILRDIGKRWLIILVLAVIVGMVAFIVTDIFYAPYYQTSTTMVVTSRDSASNVYSNLTSTMALANVYTELVGSSLFRQTILEETGLEDFSGSITASAVPDSNILTMQVTDRDPRTAFLVTQVILENHHEMIQNVMGNVALEVLQKPVVPMYPANRTDAQRVAQLALVASALLGCVLVGYMSFSRDAVRSGKEARIKLNCSYLGSIPHEKKYRTLRAKIRRPKASVLVIDPAVSFRFVESVRKICRRIEQKIDGGKSLMVVSLLENEGKSTVAVNLALVLAKKYEKVLLIDCDLRKPACAKQLKVKWTGPEVKDVLSGKAVPEDLVITDGRSGLNLLLEKTAVRNCGSMIGSVYMEQLVLWAEENYDFVILDLPPMSAVADAECIMEHADASLLVVRQNAAVARGLNRAVATLKKGKAKLLGCVLNNEHTSSMSLGQGYGSGYGRYGHYGHYGKYGRYGRYGSYGAYGSGNSRKQG